MAIGSVKRAGVMAMSFAAPRRLARLMLRPHVQSMTDPLSTTGETEEIQFAGEDGTVMRGWWIRPRNGGAVNQAVVLAHGWTGHAMRMATLIEPVLAMGYPILLYSARGHGNSDATPHISLAQFTSDLKRAITFARQRAERIAVVAHSLGASAAIVSAADGAPIESAVVLAPPADPSLVSIGIMDQWGLPGERLMLRMKPYVEEVMGRRFDEIAPMKRIGQTTCPVFLAHGTADEVVPFEHFQMLRRAAGPNVETLVVEGADHHQVKTAPETLERLAEFLPRTFPLRSDR